MKTAGERAGHGGWTYDTPAGRIAALRLEIGATWRDPDPFHRMKGVARRPLTMLNKFNFKGRDVTVVEIDGEPWFVAHEAIHILGISKGREESAYRRLAEDEYRYADRKSVAKRGGRPIRLVTESGLYKLILRSDKPDAREFQDWVTREVLPAIRRTGRLGRTSGERKPPPAAAASG